MVHDSLIVSKNNIRILYAYLYALKCIFMYNGYNLQKLRSGALEKIWIFKCSKKLKIRNVLLVVICEVNHSWNSIVTAHMQNFVLVHFQADVFLPVSLRVDGLGSIRKEEMKLF